MNRSPELADILLHKAQGDAWMLNKVLGEPGAPPWGLGFHAQQAAEKAIKSVLAAHSIEYPRTHNLALLVDLLAQGGLRLPPDAEELPRLTPFGALLRYDDHSEVDEPAPAVDKTWMRECVGRTLQWASEMIAQRRSP
jgi:HEPN domain-containing protein